MGYREYSFTEEIKHIDQIGDIGATGLLTPDPLSDEENLKHDISCLERLLVTPTRAEVTGVE